MQPIVKLVIAGTAMFGTLAAIAGLSGMYAARRIAGELLQEWNVTMSAEFPTLKDWNVELLTNRQEEAQGLTMSM